VQDVVGRARTQRRYVQLDTARRRDVVHQRGNR
jgi:hypothetical protein